MIIVGYQGIGKSSLTKKGKKYIDLESSNFWVDGKRVKNWDKIYANIADDLSQKGYIVLVSSHKLVREALKDVPGRIILAFPHMDLKDKWIAKLETRYKATNLPKDYKALENAKACYLESIAEMMSDCLMTDDFESLIIDDMSYNLYDMIESILAEHQKDKK